MIILTFIWIFIGFFIFFIGFIINGLSTEYVVKYMWICDSHFSPYYEVKEPSSKIRKLFILLGEVIMDIGLFIVLAALIHIYI
jgi:uncharacterized BrkB/YihY/UPF0761 family membrane protein